MSPPQSIEAKLIKQRKLPEKIADFINRIAGSFVFFIVNAIFFAAWILVNTGRIPHLSVFDPYPFTFLTMVVSLEAIFLSVFVLISQNRQTTIDSLREEIHLQLNQIAEREITKSLELLSDIHRAHFPKKASDIQLERMLKATDTGKIEARLEKELSPPPLAISEFLEKLEEKIPLYRHKK